MAADTSSLHRVSGLTLTVQDAGWPTVSMYGAVERSNLYLGPIAFTFGTISTAGPGQLLNQDINNVTNKLTFGLDKKSPGILQLYVTRLSPAILAESQAKEISFFGAEPNSVSKTYIGPQYGPWWRSQAVAGGAVVKPLRWAAPGPKGKILTGVLGRETLREFSANLKQTSLSRAKSLAPDKPSMPPLKDLSSSWLLLWYGSDSPFAATKMPFIDWKVKAARPRAPFWPLDNTVFHADVPLLLVFRNAPSALKFDEQKGLTFTFPKHAGRVAVLPVFGHVIQYAEDTEKWLQDFPKAVAHRCDTWAGRLAHFPVNVTESVRYDRANDRVTHSEKFEFVTVRANGKKYAPVRPMLALASQQHLPVQFSAPVEDQPILATSFGPVDVIPGDNYTWAITGLGRYVTGRPILGPSNSKSAPLEKELAAEVDRILAAGHMAPMFYVLVSGTGKNGRSLQGSRYWTDCSEQLYMIAELLAVLPSAQQAKLRKYMQNERSSYPPETVQFISSTEGTRRERYSLERTKEWVTANDRWNHKSDEYRMERKPSLYRAYGLSRFYQATGRTPDDDVMQFCRDALSESLQARQWDSLGWFRGKYSWRFRLLRISSDHQFTLRTVNRHLAGAIGYLRLSNLRSEESTAEAWGHYSRLAVLRFALGKYAHYQAQTGLIALPGNPEAVKSLLKIADFTNPKNFFHQVLDIDQHRVTLTNGAVPPEPVTFGSHLIVYRDLVPQAARLLLDWGLAPETKVYLDHYAARTPSWFVLFSDAVDGREMGWLFLADHYQLFMAHAWLATTEPDKLVQYIDVPYGKLGDLFYMHKLAETIKAYRGIKYKQPPE